MISGRLLLSAAESQLANAVAGHFKKMGLSALVSQLGSLRGHLGPDQDGVLVLAAAASADAPEIVRLVQEIVLQQWPVAILVVATDAAGRERDWLCLNDYIARQVHWPEDASLLGKLVQQRLGQHRASRHLPAPPCHDFIARRFLGATPSLWPLIKRLAAVAVHDVHVHLTGETGTGKSYLARVVHECSPRNGQRLLISPCGAIVPRLLESELFGHVKGAFSGADQAREGRFAAAGRGTLFLDEIDALGLEQQASLLRVLETGEYEQVGSHKTRQSQARIITASNISLEEAVARGTFRADLYYRLSGMTFHLPPLRERISDIPPLARGAAARFNRKFNKGLFEIDAEALAAFQRHPWPGNIRELENALLQSVLYSTGPKLLPKHIPACFRGT